MTDRVDPLTDFAALRRAGIAYAQEASGEIWTDYNIHDPGVTLLEQTCFALSQIAYQVGLPIRDLLTNGHGHFRAHRLALFPPRKVLATNPVTRKDLAAWLCSCPEIESVTIEPIEPIDPDRPEKYRPAHYDVTIVPSATGAAYDDPKQAFIDAFEKIKPLCTALGRVEVAEPIDVGLSGWVEIGSEALPETVAATLYNKVGQILAGSDVTETPATRADVWSAPERLLAPAKSRSHRAFDLSNHLAELRKLPGIRNIHSLVLTPAPTTSSDKRKGPLYYRVQLPDSDSDVMPSFTLGDAAIKLSAARVREEAIRISAETLARATHHIDQIDWDVMRPGRNRQFTHNDVDSLLPSLYHMIDAVQPKQAALFDTYRSSVNDLLQEMVDTLNTLPRVFTPRPKELETDPALHRRRRDLLDYLIALQGTEMPATRHSGLHRYMTSTARHRFELEWRLEYLFALPLLHRARATGPVSKSPGGFLTELAILCDLDVSGTGIISPALDAYGLRMDDTATLVEEGESQEVSVSSTDDPFDMLVPEIDHAHAFAPEEFAAYAGFLDDGRVSPKLLAQLTQADSFAIAPLGDDAWCILLDGGTLGPLRQIAVAPGKEDAFETVRRIRATWKQLARGSESVYLIENVRLGGATGRDCYLADLVLPGWTPRCAMESYRSYVTARVEALAPAHVHMRLHWLTAAEQYEFEALIGKMTPKASKENDAIRAFLGDRTKGEAE